MHIRLPLETPATPKGWLCFDDSLLRTLLGTKPNNFYINIALN
ncbi:hypothetical protein [Chlorogloeopsis fritschii]|nr:hypothetical protein [Chlorogloeopsis fritschii]